jgi:hypothetical protein
MKTAHTFAVLSSAGLILFASAFGAQAASAQKCDNYAKRAVQQFKISQRFRKCNLAADGRWQTNFANHYNWCLTAPVAWLNAEQGARDTHLYRCGGQIRFDDNN